MGCHPLSRLSHACRQKKGGGRKGEKKSVGLTVALESHASLVVVVVGRPVTRSTRDGRRGRVSAALYADVHIEPWEVHAADALDRHCIGSGRWGGAGRRCNGNLEWDRPGRVQRHSIPRLRQGRPLAWCSHAFPRRAAGDTVSGGTGGTDTGGIDGAHLELGCYGGTLRCDGACRVTWLVLWVAAPRRPSCSLSPATRASNAQICCCSCCLDAFG